jgi:methylmalonyl-CoA mutase
LDRLHEFHRLHADHSEKSLDRLTKVVESSGNVFAELTNTVEHCSLGQITNRLTEVVGKFRPMV